jgi:glycosyltransferase involved in cell wall biosynthesis
MKILYIQPGPGVGGAKISLRHILRNNLSNQSSQVALSPPSNYQYERSISEYVNKIHYINLPTWQKYKRKSILEKIKAPFSNFRRVASFIVAAIKIANIIKKEGIELVHTNSAISPVGALASFISGIPHIWHIRESIGRDGEYPFIVGDAIASFVFKITTKTIICNSNFTASFFDKRNIEVSIIQNGLEIDDFQNEKSKKKGMKLRQQLTGGTDSFVVGMVGNLTTPLKKHDVFLKVAKQINRIYPKCWFFIFGGFTQEKVSFNPYALSLQHFAKEMSIEERVVWVDFIDDVPSIFHSIDILIHPASGEGSGRVVMEAMASGKPVVGIQSGGVMELIRNEINGFLVPIDDIKKISDAVIFLMRNPKKKVLIENMALEYARHNFSNKASMEAIIRIQNKAIH